MICFLVVFIIFLLPSTCAAPTLQRFPLYEWSKFVTPKFVVSPVHMFLKRHHVNLGDPTSGHVPFVDEPVDFNLVKSTLQKNANISQWPIPVQNLCEEYFGGDAEELKQTFFQTRFSPGYFGVMCRLSQSQCLLLNGKERLKKCPPPQAYYGSKVSSLVSSVSSPDNNNVTNSLSQKNVLSTTFNDPEWIISDLRKDAELYQKGTPKIPDFLFDLKKRVAIQILSDFLSIMGEDEENDKERLNKIFHELVKLRKIDQSTYFEEDIHQFFESVQSCLGKANRRFLFSPDISGLQFQMTYKRGLIHSASTRGSQEGETDLTELLRVLPGVPGEISEKKDITFSGRLFLTKKAFRILNFQREAHGQTPWLDPLSAINFALASKEPLKLLDLKLNAYFDGTLDGDKILDDARSNVEKQGLPVMPRTYVMAGSSEVINHAQKSLSQLSFVSSGVRISLKSPSGRSLIGNLRRSTYTYKISPSFFETTIESVHFKVQHTGIVSAVLNVSPVNINGKNVAKFILPNETDFKNLGVAVKDKLIIWALPGLEPQIFTSFKGSSEKLATFPTKCPKCSSPLQWDTVEEKKVACCAAHLVCVDDNVRDISHFVSRRGLNVPSLSDNLIKELVEKSIVSTTTDLFQLSPNDWQLIDFVSFDDFNKILSEIKMAKNTTLARFIFAINIPSVSPLMAEELAHLAGSMEKLRKMTTSDLLESKHIDRGVARNVVKFLSGEKNYNKIEQLLKLVNISEVRKEVMKLCYKESYTQEEYSRIVKKIKECDETPHILTDFEYDTLVETAQQIETVNPEWQQLVVLPKRRERQFVSWKDPLTLKKTYSSDEVAIFLEQHPNGVIVEPKINGVACSLQYEDGKLVAAFTKVQHKEGKGFNITGFIKDTRIPKQLKMPFTGTIRGELFFSKESMSRINADRIKASFKPYIDSVGIIGPLSKSVRRQDKDECVYDEMQFFGYHLSDSKNIDELHSIETRLDLHAFLAKLGFTSDISRPKVFHKSSAASDYIINNEARRYDCPADIDGLLVKDLHFDPHQTIPTNEKYTPGILGYKFRLESLKTVLKTVHFSTGKDGVLTAVAEVDPVRASNGRNISRVFLRDINPLSEAREGDAISINYAGGASPTLQSIDSEQRKENASLIAMPKNCPACKKKLHQKEGGKLRCVNTMCMGSSPSSMLLSFSKNMGIGKGKSTQKLIDAGLIMRPSDYYRLLPEDLNESTTISSSEAVEVFSAIEDSKKVPLAQLIRSLNVPKIGLHRINTIVKHVPTLKGLLELTKENMQGSTYERWVLRQMVRYVQNNRDELTYLLKMGVTKPEGKSSKKKSESVTSIDLDQLYQTYHMREETITNTVRSILESLEKISEENKSLLQLLADMKHGGARRAYLEKLMYAAKKRNQKFLYLPLKKFLMRQDRISK